MIDGGLQWLKTQTGSLDTKFKMAIVALFMARNGEYNEARALLDRAAGAKMTLSMYFINEPRH